MCYFTHRYGFPHREIGGTIDHETCVLCGHDRVSKFQAGHWRPSVSTKPILTAELEVEILHEQAEIRRREAFWK